MVYTGLRDPSPVQTALPDDLLLGQNEWSAAHSKQTGHIIRLCDGTKSVSAFDKVAVNGVGEVLAVECMHSRARACFLIIHPGLT